MQPFEHHRGSEDHSQKQESSIRDTISGATATSKEHAEQLFLRQRAVVVTEGCEAALKRIDEELGHLPHHNRSHTEEVRQRTGRILDIITRVFPDRFPAYLKELGDIAAAYHDIERNHKREQNEEISSKTARAWMRESTLEGQPLYDESDQAIVHAAIMATIPSSADGKFKQPSLLETHYPSDTARVVSVALALSDVAVGLLEGGAAYQEDGDRRFREKKGGPFQQRLTEAAMGGVPFTAPECESLKKAIVEWSKLQVQFATYLEGEYLEEVLSLFGEDEAMKHVIRELCTKREQENAVTHARQTWERRMAMDPWALAREMRFENVPEMA